ncbi:MAG: hypothetical protein ACE5DQ_02085, partial [Candidatus Paceibacterota bacterium]
MNIKEIEKFSPSSLLYIFVTILMILTLTIRVYLFIYSFNTDSNYISMQQALGVSVGDGENKSPAPGDGEIPTLAPTQVIPPVKTPEPLPTSIQTTPQPNPTNAPFPTPTSSPVVVTPSPGDDLWILPVPGPGKPEPPITAPINLNDPNMQLQVERRNSRTTVKAYKNAGTAAAKDSLSTQEYILPRTSLGTINKWLSFYTITVIEAAGADGLLITRGDVTVYTNLIVQLNINSTSAQICTSEQSC